MMTDYYLELIEGLESSQLRQEFESFEGKLVMRDIDCLRVKPDTVNLQGRPSCTPRLSVLQAKRIGPELSWAFVEEIYTSNTFLDGFEQFLREEAVSVPAKNFDEVPDEYLYFFNTSFPLIPVDIVRTSVSIPSPIGKDIEMGWDKLKGVDYSSSCTLRMVNPETIFAKLEEIEKASNFVAMIAKMRGGTKKESVAGFECRRGNEQVTVEHFVFRRKIAVQ